MIEHKLECSECGSLNEDRHALRCELCGASLALAREKSAAGDPRIMIAAAIGSTLLLIATIMTAIWWIRFIYDPSRIPGDYSPEIWLFIVGFFGVVTVGFWRGAWRSLQIRKR